MSSRDALPSAPAVYRGDLQAPPSGSALARALLGLAGWRLRFNGLPSRQGVILVYPHTSNWDFVIGVLAKWAFGLDVRFWGKDSLFSVPLFGRWLRWLGGVAVDRASSQGLVGDTVAQLQQARERGESFWLAAAPEGTRSLAPGWRSGAYQVAVQAGVPVGLAYFDFASRTVGLDCFVLLSGDVEQDFALMAHHLADKQGARPALASPVRLRS